MLATAFVLHVYKSEAWCPPTHGCGTVQTTNTVSKERPTFGCYNFDTHQPTLVIFGINVMEKVSNQKIRYFLTSSIHVFQIPPCRRAIMRGERGVPL